MKIIAPPPLLYISTVVIGSVLNVVFELTISSPTNILFIGGALILIAGMLLARWSFITMKKNGTTASPYKESQKLTINGPFAYTRNPIYVAMTLMYFGISIIMNSLWLIVLVFPLLAVMHYGVILREEIYLESIFGKDYLNYKTHIRRWL